MKLERLASINGAILVVYYVGDLFYQYEILSKEACGGFLRKGKSCLFWDGSISQPQEMYKTAEKALCVGIKSSIKTTIGY